jgi:hypothetical protein
MISPATKVAGRITASCKSKRLVERGDGGSGDAHPQDARRRIAVTLAMPHQGKGCYPSCRGEFLVRNVIFAELVARRDDRSEVAP